MSTTEPNSMAPCRSDWFANTPAPIRVVGLFISPGHNYFHHHGMAAGGHPVVECSEVQCVAKRGIVGDRFFDFREDYKGQITFFSREVFEALCNRLGVTCKSPGVARRNVMTQGVDLNVLIGRKFEVQGVQFEGICECSPCYWMDRAIAPGAEAALRGSGGLRARILTGGTLRVNPAPRPLSNAAAASPGPNPTPTRLRASDFSHRGRSVGRF